MARYLKEVTTLAEDLGHHCGNWELNPHATEAQRSCWPGKKLSHTLLSNDAPNCLRLLKEDGHDGEPVGSRKQTAARKFFYSEDHLFPPARDLVRFGLFFHLGFYRTLHLVVKNQWEEFVLKEKKKLIKGEGDYNDDLKSFDDTTLARLLGRFRLGLNGASSADEIFHLFEEHEGMANRLGYDPQRFVGLVDQLIQSRVLYCGTDSAEVHAFVVNQEKEITMLREVGNQEEHEFWIKKCCWLEIQNELGEKLLLREDVRLKNFNITMQWMNIFGKAYLELLEVQMICNQLERRIAIKQTDPSLSDAEIDQLVQESMEKELAAIEKLREDVLHSTLLGCLGFQHVGISGEVLEQYRDQIKKILREIYRLTFPDALIHTTFTDRQKEKLRGYFEQAQKIKCQEAFCDIRSLDVLKDILANVKQLYTAMGIDMEANSIIQGETIAEQMNWLEHEIKNIERQISDIRAEIQAMAMDPDILEKKNSMGSEETQNETKTQLEQRKKELDEKLSGLREEYQRMAEEGVQA